MKDFVGLSGRRFVSLMIAVLLVGGSSFPFLYGAAEEDEAGICAQALSNCLGTAGGAALAVDWKAAVKALVICIAGYEFCRNYVEPYIREGGRP
jgi:hypothetical protein